MSYVVLARKYRPQTFDDVVGQEKTIETLKGILKSGRVPHAFLFCGPRGTGKTTCARILARELNQYLPSATSVLDLGLETSLDIIEIDGASNNGVDDVRVLRDNVNLMSISGGNKVYIIDEVHMLSTGAFNALLKTLEEPPSHVKFIFATTEVHKLPATILSRCQRFDFKRISSEIIVKTLKEISTKENVIVDEDVFFAIARCAQGGMRDALSVLDQLMASSQGEININDVNALLGLVESKAMFEITQTVIEKNMAQCLSILENVLSAGKDPRQLIKDLLEHFRDLMVMKAGGDKLQELLDRPKQYKEELYRQSGQLTMPIILQTIENLIKASEVERITNMPRLALEIALAKMITPLQAPLAQPVSVQKATLVATTPTTPTTPVKVSTPIKKEEPAIKLKEMSSLTTDQQDIGSLIQIKSAWNKITHSASRKKITVGTYLQVGYPISFHEGNLVIGFDKTHAFHRNGLNTQENIAHIESAIKETLGQAYRVELKIVEEEIARETTTAVEEALEVFGGELVNEWHNEEDKK